MKKVLALLVTSGLFLAGCSSNDGAGIEQPTSATYTSSQASTTSPTSSSSNVASSSSATSAPAVEPSPAEQATEEYTAPSPEQQAPAPAPAAEPTVIECLEGTPGPAVWSDGTTRFSQWCFDSRGGAQVLENESNAGLVQPPQQQPDPWVQGQIDWANCLEAGNSEQTCREQLN